jgi:hypothetical protein
MIQHSRTIKTLLGAACLLSLGAAVKAATLQLQPVAAASGISWAPDYALAVVEGGSLGLGGLDNGGTPFLQGALLRFNLTSLAGQFTTINSVTLTGKVRDQYPGGQSGTVALYRINNSQAGWTTAATWAQNGNGVAWSGGANMGNIETGAVLANSTVTRGDAIGTTYTWTITGAAAQQLITDWTTGVNAGLSLSDTGTGGGQDYRTNIGGIQGSVPQPTLTVDYVSVPEPATGALAMATGGLLLARRRRK